MFINDNPALTSLGLDNLDYVGSYFEIELNPELCTNLAEDLRDQVIAGSGIGGDITIEDNKVCD